MEHPALTTTYPITADRLIRQAPEIIRRWDRRVRAEIPASDKQPELVLQNNLASLLVEVARALHPSLEAHVMIAGLTLSEDHGSHRARLAEYSIGEVFVEYRMLRQTVLEVLDAERPLSPPEREVINNALEQAMQEAVGSFAMVQHDVERARGDAASAVATALQDADARKDQFLGMLAHELRTPLSAMTNAIYILEQIDLRDQRAVNQLQSLGRQTRHLGRLTEDILDITRVVQGKIDLRRERLDLRDVVKNSAETSRVFIDARGQELSVDGPPEPVFIDGDAARLEQVFTNLLNNAAKFTEAGGRIWVSVEPESGAAVVRVRDSGTGVPPAVLPQIFDMFVQAEPPPGGAHANPGMGMGLTVVRRLVELHGGTVTVNSPGAGQGTQFVVRLPLSPAAAGSDPAAFSGRTDVPAPQRAPAPVPGSGGADGA
jgi:signal transduction histidine kinase